KQRLQSETQRLAAIYLTKNAPPSWFWLWAKAYAASGQWHPLIYHLIDVGMTAQVLWDEALTDAVRERYARLLGLSIEEAGRFFAFLAASHDLGKASPAFQAKVDFLRPQLTQHGFGFPPSLGENGAPHGHITTWALKKLLPKHLGCAKRDAMDVAHAVGGHHGVWPQSGDVHSLMAFDKGDALWDQAREALLQQLVERFQPPTGMALPSDVEDRNALLIFLSGLTTTADWLGSMGEFFEYEERWLGPERYARLAADISHDALTKTGWIGWRPQGEQRKFTDLFPFAPNAIQQTLFDLAVEAQLPALVILEAPTGGGKTEAALYLADVWLQRERGRGLYVAMPTQATSNQMFDRTTRFLAHRYPHDALNVHLVHGNAAWTPQFQEIPLVGIGESAGDGLAARTWFLPRKRTLLAPFGVGTVDQVFLGVLMARHFFLRLYGLGSKVLIFDEVHAYDTYMSAIFLRLLAWLRAIGTSVIILSATLPESTRRAMIAAFSGERPDARAWPESSYPRITLVHGHEITAKTIPAAQERTIQLDWLPDDEHIIETLRQELADGGCAAVICNTVGRAQDVYLALKEAGLVSPDNLTLFHARMPFAWRKEIEERVLRDFGKSDDPAQRPPKAIVVATQVIEQSLDLDFDLMISELAPIDLLIQRAGRLHRHSRPHRPTRLAQPRLLLILPQGDMTKPEFGPSRYIYQPYLLWQTWRALEHRSAMHLPADTETLIEAVYGPFQPETLPEALQKPMTRAYQEMEKAFRSAQFEANIRLAPPPTEKKLVTRQPIVLSEDDDPRVHKQIRAMTRLIGPTLSLICLHRTPAGVFLEPDGFGPAIDLENPPPRQLVPALLQRGVTIQRRDVIRQLMERLPWRGWKEVAALRYHIPIVFEHGVYMMDDGRYILFLDRELGLRIVKKEDDA
ncbi:MAG TPA: CRISPR-associated helicase Cas3', partial [Caldilineales bacterium]|nr:CRISPR-associated helicase Cas3' [Caldilineales bacterium]